MDTLIISKFGETNLPPECTVQDFFDICGWVGLAWLATKCKVDHDRELARDFLRSTPLPRPGAGLTPHQTQAHSTLARALATGDITVLHGYAGVGKTYLLQALAAELPWTLGVSNVVVAAPTHRAKDEVWNHIKDARAYLAIRGKDLTICTVAGFLRALPKEVILDRNLESKLKEGWSEDDNNVYNPSGEKLGSNTLLIIDEAGMIDRQTMARIKKWLNRGTKKYLLLIGDPAQLGPVTGKPAREFFTPTFTLTQVIRQKGGSGLLQTVTDIRKGKTVTITDNGQDILIRPDIVPLHLAARANGEDTRIATFTNKARINWNTAARTVLFPGRLDQLHPGEGLVCYDPIFDSLELLNGGIGHIFNEEQVKVVKVYRRTLDPRVSIAKLFDPQFVGWDGSIGKLHRLLQGSKVSESTIQILFNLPEEVDVWEGTVCIPKLKVNADIRFRCALTNEEAALWELVFKQTETIGGRDIRVAVRTLFPEFAPDHSSTTHKLQGATLDVVFIDAVDMHRHRKGKELRRLAYVAATRPRQRAVLTDTLTVKAEATISTAKLFGESR